MAKHRITWITASAFALSIAAAATAAEAGKSIQTGS